MDTCQNYWIELSFFYNWCNCTRSPVCTYTFKIDDQDICWNDCSGNSGKYYSYDEIFVVTFHGPSKLIWKQSRYSSKGLPFKVDNYIRIVRVRRFAFLPTIFFLFQRKMADLAKFWNEIKGLPKEERSERIQEEYGDNPEILEILKEILANKDDNHENLENTLLKWKIMNQVCEFEIRFRILTERN